MPKPKKLIDCCCYISETTTTKYLEADDKEVKGGAVIKAVLKVFRSHENVPEEWRTGLTADHR